MATTWTRASIRSITRPTYTWNPSAEPRSAIRYVDVSAISRERLEIVLPDEIPAVTAPSRARKAIHSGDTLFATIRPGLRRVAQVPGSLDGQIASTAFCVLRPNLDLVDRDFLFFATVAEDFVDAVAALQTGASYPAVRDPDVLDQEIALPPVPEQRRIAAVLRCVRKALLQNIELSERTQDLKAAVMRELFTRGLRGEPQKETEIGPVPESWLIEPLGSRFSVVSGGTPSRDNPGFWDGGCIPWVKTTEVDYCVIRTTEERITAAGLEYSAAKLLPAGTLLMAMYGQEVTRGRVAILGIEAACNQACAAMSPLDGRINTRLVYHFFTWRYDAIRALAHGGQQQNLSLDIVRALPLLSPNTQDEQEEVVSILDAIDRKIGLHRRKRVLLEELFKSLLHNLMTGDIRVSDLDLSALPATTGAAA